MSERVCRICGIGPAAHMKQRCEDIHSYIERAVRFGVTEVEDRPKAAPWAVVGGWDEVPQAPGVEDALRRLKIPFFKRDDGGSAQGVPFRSRPWFALMTRSWLAELFHEAMQGESRPLVPFMAHVVKDLLPVWAAHHQDPVIDWWRENWPVGSVFTAKFHG